MTHYAEEKRFEIPAAFTALNGAAETYEFEAGVSLTEGDAAQANLLRVLEVLRSNGAQPIITTVDGAKVTFTVEQVHVYGVDEASVQERVAEMFGDAKAVKFDADKNEFVASETNLYKGITVLSTIGSLM
jgi:hypothetical protein